MLEAVKPNEGMPAGLWFTFLGPCMKNGAWANWGEATRSREGVSKHVKTIYLYVDPEQISFADSKVFVEPP